MAEERVQFDKLSLYAPLFPSSRVTVQYSVMTYLLHSEHKAWAYLKPSLSERGRGVCNPSVELNCLQNYGKSSVTPSEMFLTVEFRHYLKKIVGFVDNDFSL